MDHVWIYCCCTLVKFVCVWSSIHVYTVTGGGCVLVRVPHFSLDTGQAACWFVTAFVPFCILLWEQTAAVVHANMYCYYIMLAIICTGKYMPGMYIMCFRFPFFLGVSTAVVSRFESVCFPRLLDIKYHIFVHGPACVSARASPWVASWAGRTSSQ